MFSQQAKAALFRTKAAQKPQETVRLGAAQDATGPKHDSSLKTIKELRSLWKEVGLHQLYSYMVRLGKQLVSEVWKFVKKMLNSFAEKIFTGDGPLAKFLGKVSACLDPSAASYRLKCNMMQGDARISNMTADRTNSVCPNNGGNGHNWLWLEKIDTRLAPETWTVHAPDATECDGGKCSEPSKHCSSFMDDPKMWMFNNLPRGQNSAVDVKTAEDVCKRIGDCRSALISGASIGKVRCVPNIDSDDSRQREIEPQQNRYYDFMAKWQKSLLPFGSGADNAVLALSPGNTEKSLAKAYVRTGDVCLNYPSPWPKTNVRCLSQQFYHAADSTNVAKWCVCIALKSILLCSCACT